MTTTLPDDLSDDFEAGVPVPREDRDHAGAAAAAVADAIPEVRSPVRWLARQTYLVIPLLILTIFAAPSVTFLVPATQDYLGEIYQPIQALKFFKTRGQQFHKYGPAPNFILAPGYAATLLYWKVTGSFDRPAEKFPYGFKRPIEQMGALILQSRLIFLLIGIVALAYFAQAMREVTGDGVAVTFALLFCIATNYALIDQLPSPRPDSGMIAFSALALTMYVRMLYWGLSVRRGVWFSIWAVLAISCKELAAPMFVLPFLALVWLGYTQRTKEARRTIRWSFLTGVAAYAALNILYAPHTWMQRMHFWLAGPGIDADVWGHGGGPIGRIIGLGQCLLDNLGPGGILIVPIALAAFLIARPQRWFMLMLPAISVMLLGLAKIQYPADRFYTILCVALFPVVAVGLDAMMNRRSATRVAITAMLIFGAVNLWFASFSLFRQTAIFESVAERHALAQKDRSAKYFLFTNYPRDAGATRLEYFGLKHDPRSIQQIAATRTDLPDWVYASHGKLQFFQDARKMPGRAEMVREDSGFDVATWRGMEGLGYRHIETIEPQTPRWFVFDWMPAVQRWRAMGAVEVYRLSSAPARVQ